MATIKRLIEKQNELLTQALTDFKGMGMSLKELKEQLASLDNEVRAQNKSIYTLARVHTEVIRGIIFATGLNEDNGDKLEKGIKAGNEAHNRIQKDEPEMTPEADLFSEAEAEPKPKRKKAVAPSPKMRQMRSWAKHYGWTQREFRWGMVMCEIIGKDGGDDIGTCWLTPEEAQTINERLQGFTR